MIFRILDRDGTGAILEKDSCELHRTAHSSLTMLWSWSQDFSVFQNFDKDKTLISMGPVGPGGATRPGGLGSVQRSDRSYILETWDAALQRKL